MHFFYSLWFILFFFHGSLDAWPLTNLPVQDIEADSTISKKDSIVLQGSVRVRYEIGIVHCDQAIILLKNRKERQIDPCRERVEFFGNVIVYGFDGSLLKADWGELWYARKEAVFYGSSSQKVVYTAQKDQSVGGTSPPIIISGRKIVAKIARDPSGNSSFTDIQAEGSVTIDYAPLASS